MSDGSRSVKADATGPAGTELHIVFWGSIRCNHDVTKSGSTAECFAIARSKSSSMTTLDLAERATYMQPLTSAVSCCSLVSARTCCCDAATTAAYMCIRLVELSRRGVGASSHDKQLARVNFGVQLAGHSRCKVMYCRVSVQPARTSSSRSGVEIEKSIAWGHVCSGKGTPVGVKNLKN